MTMKKKILEKPKKKVDKDLITRFRVLVLQKGKYIYSKTYYNITLGELKISLENLEKM